MVWARVRVRVRVSVRRPIISGFMKVRVRVGLGQGKS